jgi:translation elongation factor P/translation initiation factor 5A
MSSIQATRLRKGMLVKVGEDLFRVLDLQHVTPGNLRGFVRVKFRNIRSGSLSDQKLRSEDFIERATLDEREMQYLYRDGDSFYFMDTETFDQLPIPAEALGDSVNYIVPGERAGEAGAPRDGPRRAGTPLREQRRRDPGQHRDRGVPVQGVSCIAAASVKESTGRGRTWRGSRRQGE